LKKGYWKTKKGGVERMNKIKSSIVKKAQEATKKRGSRKYVSPESVSMEAFALKTAVGVSPALKKEDNYIVSTLF